MLSRLALAIVVVAAGTVVLLAEDGRVFGLDVMDFAAIVAIAAVAIFTLGLVASLSKGRFGAAAKELVTAALLVTVALFGYDNRDNLSSVARRVATDLIPGQEPEMLSLTKPTGERSVRIRKRKDGHFVVNTDINGVSLPMLIDTGASTVVLRPADARAIGIDITQLRYTVPVQTANGTTYAAHVRLRGVSVGPIAFNGIEALIAQPGALKESLLGMSFLSRLRSYEFAGDFLTLRS